MSDNYLPGIDDIAKYADRYNYVPVKREILSDMYTPIRVLKRLKAVSDHVFMLESAADNEGYGRYTFLGFNPRMCITCLNGHLRVTNDENSVLDDMQISHPGKYISETVEEYKCPR